MAAVVIGTPYDIGTQGVDTASSTTIALTTTVDVSSGDRIIVSVAGETANGTGNPVSCSDTGTNTYELAVAIQYGNAMVGIFSAYAETGLSAGSTITTTFDDNVVYRRAAAAGCSGLAVINAVDITTGADYDVPGPAWSSLTVGTHQPAVLIWAVESPLEVAAATLSSTPTSPCVEVHDFFTYDGTFSRYMTTVYRIESTLGTYTVSGTRSGFAPVAAVALAAYKDDTPPTPSPDTIMQKP